jgi:hypothetical protein
MYPQPAFQPTPDLSIASTSTHASTPSLPSPCASDPGPEFDLDSESFYGHGQGLRSPRRSVSQYPLVNTALKAYEQGKASSRVVKVRFASPLPFGR